MKSTWFLWPLILLPLLAAMALFFYPKLLTGDYAEIQIDSITSPGPGEVEISFQGRISRETGFSGGTWVRRGVTEGFAGRPHLLKDLAVRVYTIRNDRGKLASPQEVIGRLSIQAGKSYRIRSNRPLTIYRYTTFDGDLAELTFAVYPE